MLGGAGDAPSLPQLVSEMEKVHRCAELNNYPDH